MLFGQLSLHQVSINTFFGEQFTVCTLLHYLTCFKNNNSITIHDGW